MRHAQDFEFRCRGVTIDSFAIHIDGPADVGLKFIQVSDVLEQIDTELLVQYLHENTNYKCVALEQVE